MHTMPLPDHWNGKWLQITIFLITISVTFIRIPVCKNNNFTDPWRMEVPSFVDSGKIGRPPPDDVFKPKPFNNKYELNASERRTADKAVDCRNGNLHLSNSIGLQNRCHRHERREKGLILLNIAWIGDVDTTDGTLKWTTSIRVHPPRAMPSWRIITSVNNGFLHNGSRQAGWKYTMPH